MTFNPDEGYIKFNYDWVKSALPNVDLAELIYWRQKLYKAKLIGSYPNGIGYGNLSRRLNGNQFIISGTATGGIAELNESHFTLVEEFDIKRNWLGCKGPIAASSESLSHAAIFNTKPEVKAIIHIHEPLLWKKYLHKLATSTIKAAYGTPEMAFSLIDIVKNENSENGVIIMGGHEDGILFYGRTLKETYQLLVQLLSRS